MIKIEKGEPPESLEVAREDQQVMMEFYYDCSMVQYDNGELKFEFSDDYHSPQVVALLVERQNNKCCFSEAKFVGDFAHVEHFRPKGRLDIKETKERLFPGYYWLANSWSNLFLCKQLINVSYKRNFFPLLDEEHRNRNHHGNATEAPLLIDPSTDNPREHIRFEMDVPIHKSERGKITIELLGLMHPHFASARLTLLRHLKGLKDSTDTLIAILNAHGEEINNPVINENIGILKDAMQPDAQFSSMIKDFLQDWPPLKLDLNLPQNL